jgi:hypothetical protein
MCAKCKQSGFMPAYETLHSGWLSGKVMEWEKKKSKDPGFAPQRGQPSKNFLLGYKFSYLGAKLHTQVLNLIHGLLSWRPTPVLSYCKSRPKKLLNFFRLSIVKIKHWKYCRLKRWLKTLISYAANFFPSKPKKKSFPWKKVF